MKSPQARDSAVGVRRARMFIQRDLAWMVGFPLSGHEWISLSLGQPISKRPLDRDLLRRSTRAVRSLRRRFPRALPQLVGDAEAWTRQRLALLEVLKPVVHEGEPLPAEPLIRHPEIRQPLLAALRRARRQAPRLEPLSRALAWLSWTDLDALRPALRWLAAHRPQLAEVVAASRGATAADLTPAVRLWQLERAHGRRRVAPCLDWLSRPGLARHPTECPAGFGQRAAKFFERGWEWSAKKPEPRLATWLAAWIESVAERDAGFRKRALELFGLLLDPELQTRWEGWWERAEATLAQARDFHRPRRDRRPSPAGQKQVRRQLRALDSDRPPNLPAAKLLRVLRELPSPDHLELYRAIVPGFRHWPELLDGAAVRLAFAAYWLDEAELCDPAEKAPFLRLVRSLCAYWRARRFRPEALEPWAPVWRPARNRGAFFHLDWLLLERLRERRRLRTFFEVLSQARVPVRTQEARLLVHLAAGLPARRVAGAFSTVRGSPAVTRHPSGKLIALAGRLTAGDEDRWLPVLLALLKHRDKPTQTLEPVADALDAAGRSRVASRCIAAGYLGRLLDVGVELAFVSALGSGAPGPDLLPATDAAWPASYPAALGPALRELARCDDRAERTARRLLRKDFPPAAALRREIAALRRAGPDPSTAIRLRRLEARLEAEPEASPGRLANLEQKLLTAAARRLVERWSRALGHACDDALRRYLDVAELPGWIRRDDVREALLAVHGLEPHFRRLARRLFRRRCGAPPWDLREDPANAAFLDRMSRLGLDLDPWLDASPTLRITDDRGREVGLALERDPIEILQMGATFDTCLAPGACNYFSVFANACDVNKQVVYGRDAHGTVVARALLALTTEGGLLAFHPYCRASGLDFERHAQDFAARLAAAMGTLVTGSGTVPRLLAPDWWDDGPTDPARRHPALEDGSDLRRGLAEVRPGRLVAAIRDAFAPLSCNELTLPLVLQLPELDERPELALGLIRPAETLELPTEALLRLVRLLVAAGALDEARTLAPRLAARAAKSFRQVGYGHSEVVELFVGLDPARALRLLRRTRPRDVRRWDQELDIYRLFLGAEAHGALGRRKQARRLLELARRAAHGKAERAECDRRLAALG